jgi:uncharacterized protein
MLVAKSVSVPVGAEEVFTRISSLEYVASCIPGASLKERDGEVHKGELSVKVGPITARYSGVARLRSVDQETRTLVVGASGKDQSNRGGADADFTVVVGGDADAATLDISADVRLRGLAAQFGRGAVDGIIEALVDEFAANLAAGSPQAEPASRAALEAQAGPGDDRAASWAGPAPQARPLAASGSLDGLALAHTLIRPQLPGMLVGLLCGALVARVIRGQRERARETYVTHAELARLFWLKDH